eukprot:3587922-Amphidinium_carterae.1
MDWAGAGRSSRIRLDGECGAGDRSQRDVASTQHGGAASHLPHSGGLPPLQPACGQVCAAQSDAPAPATWAALLRAVPNPALTAPARPTLDDAESIASFNEMELEALDLLPDEVDDGEGSFDDLWAEGDYPPEEGDMQDADGPDKGEKRGRSQDGDSERGVKLQRAEDQWEPPAAVDTGAGLSEFAQLQRDNAQLRQQIQELLTQVTALTQRLAQQQASWLPPPQVPQVDLTSSELNNFSCSPSGRLGIPRSAFACTMTKHGVRCGSSANGKT